MAIDIGLSMIVKDEARQIAACLDPIVPLLDDIVVVDTGSTDGTREILSERYGIEAVSGALDAANCNSKSPARNLGFERCRSPWIIRIDADERLGAADLERLRALEPDAGTGGYFVEWKTYRGDEVTDDYKLLLFRKGILATGCAHENMQIDIRDKGLRAPWLDGITLGHYPDVDKDPWKAGFYQQRLLCAIARDSAWYRYHWFLGYAGYRRGDDAEALRYLEPAAASRSRRFPVECLNAHMLIACVHARREGAGPLVRALDAMERFLGEVRDDFEVAINGHLGPWIAEARHHAAANRLDVIVPRRFST